MFPGAILAAINHETHFCAETEIILRAEFFYPPQHLIDSHIDGRGFIEEHGTECNAGIFGHKEPPDF